MLPVLMSKAVMWDGRGQGKGWRQVFVGGSEDPGAGDAEGIWKWGKWRKEQERALWQIVRWKTRQICFFSPKNS